MDIRRICALFALGATLTACGSTVSVDGGALDAGGLPDATSTAPTSPSDGDVNAGAGLNAGGTSGSPFGSGAGAGAGAGTEASGAATESRGAPATVTPRAKRTGPAKGAPVEVGIMVADDAQAFGDSLGIDFSTIGDLREQARALIADINRRGGFQGRPLVPVFANFQLTRADSYGTQLQAICEQWTRDHRVIAGISVVNLDIEGIADCMGKRNALFISPDQMPKLPDVYRRLPALFDAGNVGAWRLARSYVRVMHAKGFFKGDAKIGLVRFDSVATESATEKVLKPELARLGLKVTDEVTVPIPSSTSGVSATIAAAQSAVLRFKSQGITNVMTILPGAWVLFFMLQASNQEYYPQYGLTSYDWPHSLVSQGAPRDQLVNTTAIGWDLFRDIPPRAVPFNRNPAAARCRQIMSKAGQPQPLSRYCEGLFLLEAASAHASGIGGMQFGRAIEGLGSGYQPATFIGRARFGPDKHDGAASYRSLQFTTSCDCFAYVGPELAFP